MTNEQTQAAAQLIDAANPSTASASGPVLELRGVKYAAFASEETSCYEATLYVDGRPFCRVSNDGHGGGDYQHPVRGGVEPSKLDAAMFELAKRLNPEAVKTYAEVPRVEVDDWQAMTEKYATTEWWREGVRSVAEIIEGVCGRLLTDHLITRDLTRAFKTKVIFQTADGRLMECKHRGREAEAVANVRKRHAGAVILNGKPLPEAVAIMRAREALPQ